MTVDELAYDERFDNLLEMIANQRRIIDFDDYRQDVFLEILDTGAEDGREFKRAARRVADRYRRARVDADIEAYALVDEDGQSETAEEAMSRMVYDGGAVKVG